MNIRILKDGTYPEGFREEVHVCGNCRHMNFERGKCKRHEFETEGEFYPEPCDTCNEWREK